MYAQVLLGTISPAGNKITTFLLNYPRIIHSEFMTHRVFSRNSASSRAVPFSRMVERATFTPLMFGRNKPGMNAIEEDTPEAYKVWESAKQAAIAHANAMNALGVHKSIVNRIIEPYTYITVIATATDLDNFFKLRCHPDAEIHMRKLAEDMRDAYNNYGFNPGVTHSPFSPNFERSVASCARVSYFNHEGKPTTDKEDAALYNKLKTSGHWSPFEHQATWDPEINNCRNFSGGWVQFRSKNDQS